MALLVPLPLPVGEPETLLVPVGEPVTLLVPVGELLLLLLLLAELLPEPLLEAVLLGLAPLLRGAVLLALTVELELTVEEGVLAALPEPEPEPVAVPEGVRVGGAVELPEGLVEPELLGLEPTEREAEALALTVLEALRVLEGVAALLLLPL